MTQEAISNVKAVFVREVMFFVKKNGNLKSFLNSGMGCCRH